MGISDLLRKLADGAEKLEKLDFEKFGDEFRKSTNVKFKNYSNIFGCDGINFSQKDLVVSTDNLDLKFCEATKKFSVAVYLEENVNRELVSISIDDTSGGQLKVVAKCHQINCKGFLLIKGFSGEFLKVLSKCGDIHVSNTGILNIDVHSISGDVEFDDVSFEKMVVKTEDGDIDIIVNQECLIDVHSKNGDVEKNGFEKNNISDKLLKCRSKNGDITVQKV